MKKKIVNAVLSVAIVTSMMFTMTACGSKDNDKAPAESAAVTNTVEDTAKADTTDTAKADTADTTDTTDTADTTDTTDTTDTADATNKDAESGAAAEDWVSSEEASTYVELFNTMFNGAMTTEFEAEGNTLSMVFVLSEEALGTDGSDLTDEQKDEMETQMQQQYDGLKAQFEPMRDELRESIGASDLVVRIVYRTSNGTELFSQDL